MMKRSLKLSNKKLSYIGVHDDSMTMLVFDYLCHGLESVLQTFYLK